MTMQSRERRHQESDGGMVVSRWYNDTTIETVYSGRVTLRLLQQAEVDFGQLAAERPALYRLVDTSAMTVLDVSVKPGVEELWHRFKAQGGREIVFISKAPMTKMHGSVAAMNEAVKIKFFDTRAQALVYLGSLSS